MRKPNRAQLKNQTRQDNEVESRTSSRQKAISGDNKRLSKQSDREGFIRRNDRRYIAFYKPYGVLSQFSKPDDSDKCTLAQFAFPEDVYPVGRLDWDSEGLLLLSDDGALNGALLNPAKRHGRTYLVQVEKVPLPEAVAQLSSGVHLDGSKTLPARAELTCEEPQLAPRPVPIRVRKNIPTAWIKLTLFEGRNRQVRRMTAAVGHPTLRLLRLAIGKLTLSRLQLAPGQWCNLSEADLLLAFAD